ncbi:PH domain-containing protein [Actinopolyspora xinjiangensis]|uniref:PH domain-containing protein n=1 Tax=Actinopolyspora xinjiangensis TaxID=405564 RepID=A0A1H0T4A1_9ACTN|nr:PH domain-containing protein [Actinopolyspora xinjiangensis]SDP48912.1 PH domain-containing protein [Actinopolyspora xinjiangensis]
MNDSQENDRPHDPEAREPGEGPQREGDADEGTAGWTSPNTPEESEATPAGTTERERPDEAPESAPESSGRREERPELPSRLVFRLTRVSLLVILVLAVCISPVAASLPWLSVLYLVPLGLVLWVVRMRTVVDESGITARTLTGSTRMAWTEIKALRLDERHWVRAVTTSDRQVRLPALRVRDVPRLAAMSGGRIQDPSRPDGPPEE